MTMGKKAAEPPERFTLVLQPLPDTTSGVYSLKRALKCLGRTFRLKCIACWQGDASAPAVAAGVLDDPEPMTAAKGV